MSYKSIVVAISDGFRRQHMGADVQGTAVCDEIAAEIIAQQRRMPDYLHLPMRIATICFDWYGLLTAGRRFQSQAPQNRQRQLASWRNSRLGFCRNFIRFYESLFLLIAFQGEQD